MTAIEELEQYIEKEGITQISGGVFTEQTRKRLIPNEDPDDKELRYEEYQVKANTTVEEYCNSMGSITSATSMGYHKNEEPVSGEEYALELLAIMKAIAAGKCKTISGECMRCCSFMYEGEEHICDEKRVKEREESQKLWERLDAARAEKESNGE